MLKNKLFFFVTFQRVEEKKKDLYLGLRKHYNDDITQKKWKA